MPWEALISRFVVSLAAIAGVSAIYVRMLLWSRRQFKGNLKAIFDLLAYLMMGGVIAASFVGILLAGEESSMRQGIGYLGTVMFLWVCAMVPTYLYIDRFRIPAVSAVGVIPAQK